VQIDVPQNQWVQLHPLTLSNDVPVQGPSGPEIDTKIISFPFEVYQISPPLLVLSFLMIICKPIRREIDIDEKKIHH